MSNVIWFTGLSGSGKSTIATALKKKLEEIGKTVEIFDGDVVREKLHRHLGFSREDVRENNQLIAELAKKSSVDVVLVPIISPYREDRQMAREIIGTPFVELYVNAPLEECLKRDPKGLYHKAQAGETDLIGFVGSNPYEVPEKPDLAVDTKNNSVEENVSEIMALLFLPFDAMRETKLAIKAALKAGKVVLDIYHTDFDVLNEDKKFPVTKADKESHAVILSHLTDHPVISEEGDLQASDTKLAWIVDPLDGTSDFVSKTGEFTIMIALVENHVPVLAVIYWPVKDELYVAEKRKGAHVYSHHQWSQLRVSSVSDLHKTRLLASRHHLSEEEKKFIETLGLSFDSRGSSLKAMEIAGGKADLYFTFAPLRQWDTCASTCILTEAGGKATDMLGKPLRYNTPEIRHNNGVLMSNGKVHSELIRKFQDFTR